MEGDELWLARVFGSEAARGLSVGLVLPTHDGTPPSLSRLAGDLGLGVTAFLLPTQEGRWTQLAFSETRRLRASPAALLVGAAVLRHKFGFLSASFDTPDGVVTVRFDAEGVPWAALPVADAPPGVPLAPLASAVGRRLPGGAPERVVSVGGVKSCYREIRDPASLQLIDFPRERAWSYLRHEGLAAICLFARGGSEVCVRVFTASREGREAAVSPEILSGLDPCLGLGADGGAVVVHQGRGAARRRGAFRLRAGQVGSPVKLLGRGTLLSDSALGRLAC